MNFLAADVHNAVGPFLAIYLAASRYWNARDIGIAISVASIAGLIAQTPAGLLVDRSRHKPEALAAATAILGIGALLIVWRNSFAEWRFASRPSRSAFSVSSCRKQEQRDTACWTLTG